MCYHHPNLGDDVGHLPAGNSGPVKLAGWKSFYQFEAQDKFASM